MFDSRSLRRKLGNFIPVENVRQSLQNVLTVEWDTHKTVLVDVPGAVPGGNSPDVEMEGLGLNRREKDDREGYGRLEDDRDDDYVDSPYSNPNMGIEPSSSSGTYFDRPIARPSQSTSRSGSYQSQSDKRLPQIPSPSHHQQHSNHNHNHYYPDNNNRNNDGHRMGRDEEMSNPFADIDDFAPAPGGSGNGNGFLQPNRENQGRQERTRARTMEQGWDTFGNPSTRTPSPAHQRYPGVGLLEGGGEERGKVPHSPSSSRGTRDSAQTASSDENPFR